METVYEAEVAGMLNPVTEGAVVSEDGAEPNAVAMAWTWAEVRLDREPIPPLLALIALWIWVAVLPLFSDEARAP